MDEFTKLFVDSQVAQVWQEVPNQAFKLAAELEPLARDVREIAYSALPYLSDLGTVYYARNKKSALLNWNYCSDCEPHLEFWEQAFEPLFEKYALDRIEEPGLPTLRVPLVRGLWFPDNTTKRAQLELLDEKLAYWLAHPDLYEVGSDEALQATHKAAAAHQKLAGSEGYSPTLRGLGELAGYLPDGQLSWHIPNVPLHLQGMLGGGLLGAGLGYGAGMIGSRVLPRSWDRTKLPRTLAVLGGMAGTAPGVAAMLSHAASTHNPADSTIWSDDRLMQAPPPHANAHELDLPTYPSGSAGSAEFHPNPAYDPMAATGIGREQYKYAAEQVTSDLHPILKQAISATGYEDIDFGPPEIPVDYVNQTMWDDPRVSQGLPEPVRGATTGLLESAWLHRQQTGDVDQGSGIKLVRPSDIAAITAGMGSGYVSGAIIGKILGGLVGLPQDKQEQLKNIGLWAGVISNVVPLAFGR